LIDLMNITVVTKDEYSWLRCTVPEGSEDLDLAAKQLAERILVLRCGAATQTVDAWRQAVESGMELTVGQKAALAAFIRSGFGVPSNPLSNDHLQGMTAEYLWYFATIDHAADSGVDIARIEAPGPSPSTSGGDGLVIIRDGEEHSFFLWEIKKNTGSARVSASVKRAYDQLNENGLEYLARYVGPASVEAANHPPLLAAIGSMVDDWSSGADTAGAGIAVATSVSKTPSRCFSKFPDYFPSLKPRLRGAVYGMGDFTMFGEAVKEALWTGL
jgi:hypothetical protein